jgi:hypothetical protein
MGVQPVTHALVFILLLYHGCIIRAMQTLLLPCEARAAHVRDFCLLGLIRRQCRAIAFASESPSGTRWRAASGNSRALDVAEERFVDRFSFLVALGIQHARKVLQRELGVYRDDVVGQKDGGVHPSAVVEGVLRPVALGR